MARSTADIVTHTKYCIIGTDVSVQRDFENWAIFQVHAAAAPSSMPEHKLSTYDPSTIAVAQGSRSWSWSTPSMRLRQPFCHALAMRVSRPQCCTYESDLEYKRNDLLPVARGERMVDSAGIRRRGDSSVRRRSFQGELTKDALSRDLRILSNLREVRARDEAVINNKSQLTETVKVQYY